MNIGGASRLGHGVNKLTLDMPPDSSKDGPSGSPSSGSPSGAGHSVLELTVSDGPLGMTVEELVPHERYGSLVGVAVITKVVKGGQAHKLGAKRGDRIVGVGGREAISMGNFKAKIQFREGGVEIKIVRVGKRKNKDVTL